MSTTPTTSATNAPDDGAGVPAAVPAMQIHEPHRVGLPPLRPYLRMLWQRRQFGFELSRTTLRAQQYKTLLGQLSLVITPLLLAGVYFVLVDILRSGSRGAEFLVHLVACLFAYQIIQQSLNQGVRSVVAGGRLILNTAFPRILLPLSSVMTSVMRFLPTVPVYLVIHIAAGRPLGWEMLWAIPVVALFVLLAAALTIAVAAAQVYFRDLRTFLPYALRVWLYASPVLYFADEVPERYDWILTINPLAPLLTAWSDAVSFARAPDLSDLLLGLAWALALLVVASAFFMSREREFAVRL